MKKFELVNIETGKVVSVHTTLGNAVHAKSKRTDSGMLFIREAR